MNLRKLYNLLKIVSLNLISQKRFLINKKWDYWNKYKGLNDWLIIITEIINILLSIVIKLIFIRLFIKMTNLENKVYFLIKMI